MLLKYNSLILLATLLVKKKKSNGRLKVYIEYLRGK